MSISLLDSKLVLTPKPHISLDWKFQSSPTYTLRFAHVTLQSLGLEVMVVLSGRWCLVFILVISSTILVLMTMSTHKTTYNNLVALTPYALMATKDVYNMDEIGIFYRAQPNKDTSTRKSLWVQNSKGPSHSCFCCKYDKH